MNFFNNLKTKLSEIINTKYNSLVETSESNTKVSTIKNKISSKFDSNINNNNIEFIADKKIKDNFLKPNEIKLLSCELTNPELKILHYLSNIFEKNISLPNYLSAYSDILDRLINDGYFTEPDPNVYLQKKLKVQDLKDYLKLNNLPVSGKKDILVQRIIENIPKNKLSEYFNLKKYYTLSPKGIDIITKYPEEFLYYMEFYYVAKLIYDNINESILHQNPGFVCEDIKFIDNYKNYELAIKAFILAKTKITDETVNRLTFKPITYSDLFKALYNVEIPESVFINIRKYYSSLKELDKIKGLTSTILKKYRILTMNDERTCSFCKQREKKDFLYSNVKIGINYPPFYNCENEYCRCFVESIFEDI